MSIIAEAERKLGLGVQNPELADSVVVLAAPAAHTASAIGSTRGER